MSSRSVLLVSLASLLTLSVLASPVSAAEETARIAAVGDMVCDGPPSEGADPRSDDRRYLRGFCQYGKVSDLVVDGGYDRFLPLGDLQYYFGALPAFRRWYDPTFGRAMNITAPVPGNHEAYSIDADGNPFAGYRAYFGDRAHWNRRGGSYSFDIGDWHVVVANSEWCRRYTYAFEDGRWSRIPMWSEGSPWGCHAGDPLREWLERDLERHAATECTLLAFHHPAYFWAGSPDGPDGVRHGAWYSLARPLYRVFYRTGGDVVLTGHQHFYERFVPIDARARLDPEYGFTQFIVGTGGDTLQRLPRPSLMPPQVAAASDNAFGILEMELQPGGFDWRFAPAEGSPGSWRRSEEHGFRIFENGDGTGTVDEGSGVCHDAPPTSG
jgi:hypothetical protein